MNPINDKGEVKTGSTHEKFTADMAMKTVINKLCKAIVNASSDKSILLERMNRAEDLSDRAAVEAEIEDEANTGKVIDITTVQQDGENKEIVEEMAPGECPDNVGTTYQKSTAITNARSARVVRCGQMTRKRQRKKITGVLRCAKDTTRQRRACTTHGRL